MDKMTDSRAAEAQAQGGGEVRAKTLEWMEDGGDWGDRHHGFHITRDEDWPQENSFIASWGESDVERFTTLEEAQAWCQEVIDRYIREWAITAPPSAPVGVEAEREFFAQDFYEEAREGKKPWPAQQPAADGKVPGCEDCAHNGRYLCDEHGPKPAAVDGAVRQAAQEMVAAVRAVPETKLLALDADPHPPSALSVLADDLAEALAAQPGGYDSDR